MEKFLLGTMLDRHSTDSVDEVMIDKDLFEGRKEPVRVHVKAEGAI